MKFLLIAALVSLAAGCQEQEYVYRYTSQVLTGVVPNSPLRTGLKLTATARTQVTCTDNEVKVQLTDVILYKIDQPFVQVKAEMETIPNELLKELMGENPAAFVKALQKPFGFKWTNGLVSNLKFDEIDVLSMNVKKGFISLFEVNLQKNLLLKDDTSAVDSTNPEQTMQYTVLERSTTGDCATKYVVRPMTHGSVKMTTVDKVRDYSRCLNVPVYRKSPFFDGIKMADSLKANPLTHSNNIRYVMRGDIITSVVAEERIIFTPTYTPTEIEEVRTTMNQTLVLYDTVPLSKDNQITDIKVSQASYNYHKRNHLVMSLATDVSDKSDYLNDVMQLSGPRHTVDKIVTELRLAAENIQDLTSKESVIRMAMGLDMLRTADYNMVKKVFDMLSATATQDPKDRFAKEILWTALGNVGTEAAANFLIDTCSKDVTLVTNCSWALSYLTLTATPTAEIINKLTALRNQFAQNPVMKMKIHLTLGSFVYKMNTQMIKELVHIEEATKMITPLLTEENKSLRSIIKDKMRIMQKRQNRIRTIMSSMSGKIMKIVTAMLNGNSVQDKILALKVIRNSGLQEAVPVLKEFLLNEEVKQNSPYLRVPAVLAFSKIAMHHTARPEIKDFMMNILMDTKEVNEVRSAAFTVLMTVKPELTLLEIIASRMHSEKDLQLSSYIISYLQNYANSTYKPVWAFSKNATVALKSAPEYITGTGHSFYKFGGLYDEKYRMGSSIKLASRGSMDRFMSLDLGLESSMFGVSTTPFAMHVDTQGMTTLLNKLFGAKGMKTLSGTLGKILKSNPLKMDPKQFISDIVSGLKMEHREMEEFHGQAQLHVFGHEMMYFESIKDLLQMFMPEGASTMKMTGDTIESIIPMNRNDIFFVVDAKVILPSEAGLPISLQTKIIQNHKITGDVKVKATLPTERSNTNSMMPTNIGMEVDINKKGVVGLYAHMGLECFLAKATVGVNGMIKMDVPYRKKISFDMTTKILEHNMFLPQQKKPIIETYFEPASDFVSFPNNKVTPTVVYTSRPIYAAVNQRVTPIDVSLPCPFIGHVFRVMGQAPAKSVFPIHVYPLRGRSDMTFSLIPGTNPASVLTFKYKVMTSRDIVTTPTIQTNSAGESDYQNDMIDLPRVTLPMVLKKLSMISGRPVPVSVSPWDAAVVLTMDASTDAVSRKMHIEGVTRVSSDVTHEHFRMMRMWVSPIPGHRTAPFQLLGEVNVLSRTHVHQPEDIYSIEWQKQLINDIKTLTQTKSQAKSIKVFNSILKMTMTSMTQQLHTPTLDHSPASRILEGVMPSIYFSKNMKTPIPEKCLSVFTRVQEEEKMVVDPYFMKRDVIVLDLISDLINCMEAKLNTLKSVVKNNEPIKLSDLVYTQWTVMKNEKTLGMLRDIFVKYLANGAITRIEQIKSQLHRCSAMVITLLKEVQTIILNKPITYQKFKPESEGETLEKITLEPLNKLPKLDLNDPKMPVIGNDESVLTFIKQLGLMQIKEIVTILEKMNKVEKIDVDTMVKVMHKTDTIITNVLERIPKNPSFILLNTIQNELLMNLWQSYMKMCSALNQITAAENDKMVVVDFFLKSLSFKLSGLVSRDTMAKRVAVILNGKEDANMRTVRQNMFTIQRNVMIETSRFLNITSVHTNVEMMEQKMNKLYTALDENMALIVKTIEEMKTSPSRQHVVIVFSVMESANSLSHMMKLCRQRIVSFTTPQRITWIRQLEKRNHDLIQIMADIAPLLERKAQDFVSFMRKPEIPNPRPMRAKYPTGKPLPTGIKSWGVPTGFYGWLAPDAYRGSNSGMHSSMFGHLNITWGINNVMDKTIFMQGYSTRSVEQIMWFMKQLNPSSMNRDLLTALTARMSGEVSVKESFKDIFNTYNHITMETTVTNMPQWLKEAARTVQETLKMNLWDYYTRHRVSQPTDSDKIYTEIDVSEINNKVDFYLATNGESDAFVNVPINPAMFKTLKPTQSLRPISEQFIEFVSGGFIPATCSIHGNQVTTFDKVGYSLPDTVTHCRTLLAMDCSREETFAIAMVPSEKDRAARTLEISSQRRLVQVTALEEVLEIIVDGKPVTVETNKPLFDKDLIIEVQKTHCQTVKVILRKLGVTVTVKGSIVVLEASQLLKNRVCGLCGNFDGQKTWEFEGPTKEIYMNKTSFAVSYVVPNSVCPASIKPPVVPSDLYPVPKPGHVNKLRILKGVEEEKAQDKECSINYITKMKKYRKKNLVCFSTQPVSECSFDCHAEKIVYTRPKILYTCLDMKSKITNQLVRLVRTGEVVQEDKLEKHAIRKVYRKTTMEDNCML